MFKVYIADDEYVVRQGLKNILKWQEFGFEICGEAGNGETAYKEIMEIKPDLALIDIRMPKLEGLDLAHKLRNDGFSGRIIVISVYSEFKYAQKAISYHVDYYLTKPIDDEELKAAVSSIYSMLKENQLQSKYLNYYQKKAKLKILEDLIKKENGNMETSEYTLEELDLEADSYQVLILDKLHKDFDAYAQFCRELKISSDSKDIEHLHGEQYEILLLKGRTIINKFTEYKEKHFADKDKSFVIIIGKVVTNIFEIYHSYHEALVIKDRSFFYRENMFIKDNTGLSIYQVENITVQNSAEIGKSLYELIIVYKQQECLKLLDELFYKLTKSSSDAETIKNFLAGMLIYIIQEFKKDYKSFNMEFKTSAEIIAIIQGKSYLYEISAFIKDEIVRMIKKISNFSSDGILEEVISFIEHHFADDIKLNNIAYRFGYNSSYLGKIFNKKYGVNFNDYLHKVRIDKAKELLLNKDYKVYSVANMVGYTNVDYFHMKFKQFVGCTPNEYRSRHIFL